MLNFSNYFNVKDVESRFATTIGGIYKQSFAGVDANEQGSIKQQFYQNLVDPETMKKDFLS